MLILQYNDWTRRLSITKNQTPLVKEKKTPEGQGEATVAVAVDDEEEEDPEVQMQRMEEKIFLLKEEIMELKGQIEGNRGPSIHE